MKKILLVGQENIGSAIDDDFRFTKSALSSFSKVVDDVEKAEVIHGVNWNAFLKLDVNILKNKIVVTHIPHDVRNMLMQPEYLKIAPFVDLWIVPSRKAQKYADQLGLKNAYIPYGIDTEIFYPMSDKKALREKYELPRDKYLIGSFQRDTEGKDLKTPKYIKGPDIFLEIVKKIFETEKNIHVVLAGPRRFWLKKKLEENGIPYSFVGQNISDRDDLKENTLNHKIINELYNAIDLYVVSSRLEGGPKAILECAASKTKIISTDVGQAGDILNENQIYGDFLGGAKIVMRDKQENFLEQTAEENYQKSQSHILAKISKQLKGAYELLAEEKPEKILFKEIKKEKPNFWEKMATFGKWNNSLTIFFEFHKGPWGGGNQFLGALSHELEKQNFQIKHFMRSIAKGFLFNSFHIDFEKMKTFQNTNQIMMHRIDGPTFLIRDKDKELDDNIFAVNNQIADISIFQSAWSLLETLRLGYHPINPVLIHNASDAKIFNRSGRIAFSKNRKIRLISTSWSNNPRKGGPIYKWLDENLDWSKYEYTFVGRVSEELQNIKMVEAVPSEKLAEILKQHDIYITASDNDPCSNALIEALTCGLPAVYFNRGGHPELVGTGGLGFDTKEQIPEILERLIENYQTFQDLIVAQDMEKIAAKYAKCLK